MKRLYIVLVAFVTVLSSCRDRSARTQPPAEDRNAKQMLQGVWVDEDVQDVAFQAKGDTIFYPDSTSQPVYFQIFKDTLVLHGANDVKYPILRQTRHLFVFRNQNGDEVRLVLSDNPDDKMFFSGKRPMALNQNRLIKRDTVVSFGREKYHCYVQVNPTTYKVVKTTYNDDGVAVDNIYHDNIINLNVYHGSVKLFSGDFRKQQFAGKVPREALSQSILSDLTLRSVDESGIHYVASLMIPDSMSSFEVMVTVGFDGRMNMRVF